MEAKILTRKNGLSGRGKIIHISSSLYFYIIPLFSHSTSLLEVNNGFKGIIIQTLLDLSQWLLFH